MSRTPNSYPHGTTPSNDNNPQPAPRCLRAPGTQAIDILASTPPASWRRPIVRPPLLWADQIIKDTRTRIHESVITYDGHISRPSITELELGPSENSYSRARKRSVIVVLEVGGFHTGCLVTKPCTAHGRRVICPARQSSGE